METESGSVATIVACPHCSQELEIPAVDAPPLRFDARPQSNGKPASKPLPTLAPPHPDDTVRALQAVEYRLQHIEAHVASMATRSASSGLQVLGGILLVIAILAVVAAMGSSMPDYLSDKSPAALLEELIEIACRGIGMLGFLLALLIGAKALEWLSGK